MFNNHINLNVYMTKVHNCSLFGFQRFMGYHTYPVNYVMFYAFRQFYRKLCNKLTEINPNKSFLWKTKLKREQEI